MFYDKRRCRRHDRKSDKKGSNFRLGSIAPITGAVLSFLFEVKLRYASFFNIMLDNLFFGNKIVLKRTK